MSTIAPAQITWQQIPLGVKMSLGARNQHLDNKGRSLVMNVGPGRGRYEVWVTLNGYDLYDITLFKSNKEVWSRFDIYCENLGEVLLRMESENWG